MKVYRSFLTLIFLTTYLGIFFLRIFHYGFIYERPSAIILECVPTVSISFFLILACALVEKPILRRFERLVYKAINKKESLSQSEVQECWDCYKKFDIAIAAGDAIGFLLGAGSTAIIEAAKGIVEFDPVIFVIIELQSVGVGFLCYTLNVFVIKKLMMTKLMRNAGISVSDNLSKELTVAVGTCVYISVVNMSVVPINLLRNPSENAFSRFLLYAVIAAVFNFSACFVTYKLLIRQIQKGEKEISKKLMGETEALATSLRESAQTSQNQSAAVKEIVATMQDSTLLATNIGDKIKHVTALAENSRDAVVSGRVALKKNVDELLEIKKSNLLTIDGIKDLNKKISGIWDIVSIINVVADQTKIIAFNAELEASSSGEAGKNFHIVATEIRRLSDNIIDSIKEIREHINDIQKASDSLILDSEKGSSQIDSGCASAKSLESGFESILSSSDNTANSAHEILDYVSQLESSSEQIFITLKQIASGIETFSESASNISSSSENVRKIASLL